MNVQVVIPSKGRADEIGEHALALFPDAIVCVEESEEKAYLKVVPKEQLVLHPLLPPMGPIRNWILENIKAEALVMIDDDVWGLACLVGWRSRRYRDPAVARQLLENTAICARDAQSGLFGFTAQPNPMHFNGSEPFKLNAWARGVIGFLEGHGLKYDNAMAMHDDIDLCLKSLVKHRIIWYDDRWCFLITAHSNRGGLASYRSDAHYQDEHRRLQERWGQYITFSFDAGHHTRRHKGLPASTMSTHIHVNRKAPLAK